MAPVPAPDPVVAARGRNHEPRRAWFALLFPTLLILVTLGLAGPATAAPSTVPAAAQDNPAAVAELAHKYAPVVVIREQVQQCGTGEPYLPVPVTTVLGDPQVVLRDSAGQVVTTAPTAARIAGLGEGYYLDIPGDPLDPKCDFEKWFDSKNAKPTVYARVAHDPDFPDQIALQYWFYWVFNDWNDKHESDWEMIQLQFDAPDATAALQVEPMMVAFAQHEGSEVASWDDPKLHRDGNHIAVYPGQGSHAAYFTQSLRFGKSAAAGFGCDSTEIPGTLIRPEVIVMPSDPTGDFVWLTFTGRWGQKAPSFNNGPTGPNTKTQWTHPITWAQEEGRPAAVAIPALAGNALNAFCRITESGSLLFLDLLASPWLTTLVLLGVIALLVAGIRATRWRGRPLLPLAQPRAAGQILIAASRWCAMRWRVTGGVALALLLANVTLFGISGVLLAPAPNNTDLTQVGAPAHDWGAVVVLLLIVAVFVGATLLQTAILAAVTTDATGAKPSLRAAIGRGWRNGKAWLLLVFSLLLIPMLTALVVTIPLLAYIGGRWGVASPASVAERLGLRASLRRASQLSVGWRKHSVGALALLIVIALAPPGLLGAALLLVAPVSFWTANLLAGALGAVLVPLAVAGWGLLYLDLHARREGEAGPATVRPNN